MSSRNGTPTADDQQREGRLTSSAIELLQSHPVATLLIAKDGSVVEVNQAVESMLNRARNGLVGRYVVDALAPRNVAAVKRLLRDPAQYGWAYASEVACGDPSSEPVLVDMVIGPASPPNGWRTMALHAVPTSGRMPFRRPGTGARSAEAAAALLAHEIKNPLSGIRGAAQLMGKSGGEKVQSLSRLICGEVDRIAGLIDGMQGFTRGLPMQRTSINIYPALAQARAIATQGFAAGAQIIEEFDPSLPRIMGNHDALVQILINLLKNAAEAKVAGTHTILRLTTAFRYGLSWDCGDGNGPQPLPVEIAVADNGPGVPDHLVDTMFDPFISSKRDGQGLGLALVDKLARDMGGMIHYERRDGWTRFRLHLPLARGDGNSKDKL